MKIFNFKRLHGFDSQCGLSIIPSQNAGIYVVLTELGSNPGTSITNFYENIATQIYHLHLKELPITDIHWIEHYNADSYKSGKIEETFDEVKLTWKDNRFTSLAWHRCDSSTSEYIKNKLTS